jgi:hypothetical protein
VAHGYLGIHHNVMLLTDNQKDSLMQISGSFAFPQFID